MATDRKDRPKARRKKAWSQSAGRRGVNRCRVYEVASKGVFIEWYEDGSRQRKALGRVNHDFALMKLGEVAQRLAQHDTPAPSETTLGECLLTYEREKTPTKGETA